MFNTEILHYCWPILRRVGRQLWRIGQRLYHTHTHTPILEESALESALELAYYSSESANSNAYSPRIGVWVRAFTERYFDIVKAEIKISEPWIYIPNSYNVNVCTMSLQTRYCSRTIFSSIYFWSSEKMSLSYDP